MEVSAMSYICRYCVFTWYSRMYDTSVNTVAIYTYAHIKSGHNQILVQYVIQFHVIYTGYVTLKLSSHPTRLAYAHSL